MVEKKEEEMNESVLEIKLNTLEYEIYTCALRHLHDQVYKKETAVDFFTQLYYDTHTMAYVFDSLEDCLIDPDYFDRPYDEDDMSEEGFDRTFIEKQFEKLTQKIIKTIENNTHPLIKIVLEGENFRGLSYEEIVELYNSVQ